MQPLGLEYFPEEVGAKPGEGRALAAADCEGLPPVGFWKYRCGNTQH